MEHEVRVKVEEMHEEVGEIEESAEVIKKIHMDKIKMDF